MATQRRKGSLIEVSVDDHWKPPVPSNDPGAAFGVPLKPSDRSSAGKGGATAQERKEALEVKLHSASAERAPEVGSPREARKEALEVKLKPTKERSSPKGRTYSVVREALTVKLRSARDSSGSDRAGGAGVAASRRSHVHRESERKEGLLQLERLRHVNSGSGGHSRRGSATPSLRKMASSLLQAGGVLKPSTLFGGGDRGTGDRHTSREDFTQLVAGAHEQLKSALAAQEAELERLAEEEAQQARDAEARRLQVESMRAVMRQIRETPDTDQSDQDREKLEAQRQVSSARRHEEVAKAERALVDVLDELLVTEATYLEDLRQVVKRFVAPLQAGLLPPNIHAAIFCNLVQLVELHAKLGTDLAPAAAVADPSQKGQAIAKAFLVLAPFFRMYAVYSANYANVPETLATAKQDGAVFEFFAEEAARADTAAAAAAAAASHTHATLEALLFRPVQRMCLYPLLFKQAVSAQRRLEQTTAELHSHSSDAASGEASAVGGGGGGGAGSSTVGRGSGGAGGSSSSGGVGGCGGATTARTSSVEQSQLEQVFEVIQKTLGKVNEDVRTLEAHVRTMDVLVAEVRGGDALLSATRVLRHEAVLDMKVNRISLRTVLNSNVSVKRSAYKWYVFPDEILICAHSRDGLYHMKALLALREDDHSVAVTIRDGRDPAVGSSPRGRASDDMGTGAGAGSSFPRGKGDGSAARLKTLGLGRPLGHLGHGGPWPLCLHWKPMHILLIGLKACFHCPIRAALSIAGSGGAAEHKVKPEVFFVNDGGLEYKCWATSEGEKRALLRLIDELREGLREKAGGIGVLGGGVGGGGGGGPMSPLAKPGSPKRTSQSTPSSKAQPQRPSAGERVPF